MSNNVEWAALKQSWEGEVHVEFSDIGEVDDPFGNTNELPALFFGDGICIEGTKPQWIEFAEKLLVAAKALRDEEDDDE